MNHMHQILFNPNYLISLFLLKSGSRILIQLNLFNFIQIQQILVLFYQMFCFNAFVVLNYFYYFGSEFCVKMFLQFENFQTQYFNNNSINFISFHHIFYFMRCSHFEKFINKKGVLYWTKKQMLKTASFNYILITTLANKLFKQIRHQKRGIY